MAFEHYINKGGHRLRLGFTTGTCAALAARAAAWMLLSGAIAEWTRVMTPKGIAVTAPVLDVDRESGSVSCAVQKDAGDDPDATDGVLVYARVKKTGASGITVTGGDGIGRVTKPGLEQPVGASAVNSVPRRMIEREVKDVCAEFAYAGGLEVVISIPGGAEIATRTFNASLGIEGGLSVIGTSGIVEPMSSQAIIDTIAAEMKMHRAGGADDVVVVPGNYGESFLRSFAPLAGKPWIKCSNFIGEAVDTAAALGFSSFLLVGHIGKLVKVAAGVMDTHSRVADCRLEMLALQAALNGADAASLREILACPTVDEGLEKVDGSARGTIVAGLLERMEFYLRRRARDDMRVGVVTFSNRFGFLGAGAAGGAILEECGES